MYVLLIAPNLPTSKSIPFCNLCCDDKKVTGGSTADFTKGSDVSRSPLARSVIMYFVHSPRMSTINAIWCWHNTNHLILQCVIIFHLNMCLWVLFIFCLFIYYVAHCFVSTVFKAFSLVGILSPFPRSLFVTDFIVYLFRKREKEKCLFL